MNTIDTTPIVSPASSPTRDLQITSDTDHASAVRRFFGVVARSRSYRSIAYLVLGLPLGTVWFTVLVTGLSLAALARWRFLTLLPTRASDAMS